MSSDSSDSSGIPAAPAPSLVRLRIRLRVPRRPPVGADASIVGEVIGPLGMIWHCTVGWRARDREATGALYMHLDAHEPTGHPYTFTATASNINAHVYRGGGGAGWVRTGLSYVRDAIVTFAPPAGWRWGSTISGGSAAPIPSGELALVVEWDVSDARATPPSAPWAPGPAPCVGIDNQGATCYLNSLLQVCALARAAHARTHARTLTRARVGGAPQTLFHTRLIRRTLLDSVPPGAMPGDVLLQMQARACRAIPACARVTGPPTARMQLLFLSMQHAIDVSVETEKLTRAFGWASHQSWQQQDVQVGAAAAARARAFAQACVWGCVCARAPCRRCPAC